MGQLQLREIAGRAADFALTLKSLHSYYTRWPNADLAQDMATQLAQAAVAAENLAATARVALDLTHGHGLQAALSARPGSSATSTN